jgi:hypothetical protein
MFKTRGKSDKKPSAEKRGRAEERKTSGDAREFPLRFRVRNFLLWNSVDTSRFWNLTRSALATSTLRLETPLRLYFSLPSASSPLLSSQRGSSLLPYPPAPGTTVFSRRIPQCCNISQYTRVQRYGKRDF